VTHRFDEVLEIADRATMLRDGEVVGTVEREQTSEEVLGEMMVGRALARETVVDRAPRGEVVFSCAELSGGALVNVGFELHRGEILGIAGLLGSGRSTLLRTVFGLHAPETGTMTLEGDRYAPRSIDDAMAKGVAYVPEDRIREAAFLELPVTD